MDFSNFSQVAQKDKIRRMYNLVYNTKEFILPSKFSSRIGKHNSRLVRNYDVYDIIQRMTNIRATCFSFNLQNVQNCSEKPDIT